MAYAVLVAAVRGRRDRGGDWGEAVLAEFAETSGTREAMRWALGGLRVVWHERRRRVARLPRVVRVSGGVALVATAGIAAGLLVDQYVLAVPMVVSGSMEPTLQVGDRFLVDKVGFRLTGLHRGDIVMVTMGGADAPASTRIKRVIGLPGDTITCRDGQVWRNGSRVDEPYLEAGPDEARTDCAPVTVPAGRLYLLGDHRIVSMDSRQDGTVRQAAVQARLLTRVWPLRT
jgi:signal peptidase I